ncbi:GNAT family N-acetyltransferase [Chengkuizengella sediminis]|nr:GNAT family N-acetyltransferase [Chengkuizengella sediminis]
MSEEIYKKFTSNIIIDYAEDKVEAGTWLEEEALEKSKEDFERSLPQGRHTKQHFLLSIVNEELTIGWLWYFFDDSKLQKEAFIYEFYIYEEQRGKGYGIESLTALDKLVREKGIEKISLHVFAHNERAIHLYKKMNYEPTAISMSKKL